MATGRDVLDLESEGAYRDILTKGGKLTKIGANVLVLGCTGMTHWRARLQDELGVPIIEPYLIKRSAGIFGLGIPPGWVSDPGI